MDCHFFFGPDKTPFELDDNGVVETTSTTPFHGIISKGLLNKLRGNNVPARVWHNNAHLLESKEKEGIEAGKDLGTLKAFAAECNVLSFSQSAFCAKMCLEGYFKGQGIKECDIWNIKEGHTSSVWKVTYYTGVGNESFALNVARDTEAGVALMQSAEKMKKIGDQLPETNIAKVLDSYILQDTSLLSEVVITRNEWVDNAYEIHSRKNKVTGKRELLMVDRFITHEDSPARITSVLGRLFTTEEVKIIQKGIDAFIRNWRQDTRNKRAKRLRRPFYGRLAGGLQFHGSLWA